MQNNNAQGLTYNIEASLTLKSECSQESNKIRNLQQKCENRNFAQTPAINSPYWTIHRYVTGNVCNSQLVNKVGCFRVFVVFFFCEFPRLGKGYQTLTWDRNIPFFSLVMGISCPSIFPAWELNVPHFHIPKIPQDGILVSQTLSGTGF